MNRNGELQRAVVFGGLLCLMTLALPNSLRSALAVCFVLALPLFAWIALRVPRDEAQALFALVAAAVGVRLIVATVIATLAPENFFSLDQRRYEWLGEAMARAWAGEGSLPENIHAKPGYYVWNALVYSAVGFVPLAVTFSNAAIAGGSVVLVYRIARDLADVRAARIAAGLAAFFPSLVLWSSLNLKDAAAIVTLLLVVRGTQRLQQRPSAGALVQLCVGVALLSQLRDYLVWIVLAGAAVGLVLPRLRSVPALLLVAATLAGVALTGAAGLQSEQMPSLRFDLLEQHRRNLAVGGSAYHGDADVSSPLAALRFLPVGLGYFLFAPAPWQLWNARQWMTLPEMLAWYALLPQIGFGLRGLWQRREAACLPLLAIAVLITVAYALVEANLGTAYRHRAQVLVLYLTIAAIGVARERSVSRSAVAPAEVPA
ncbi:MAG: glycosyltransferase family 39 protein [Myxococcota bacterium]